MNERTEPPGWTDYIVNVGTDYAAYLERSGVHAGGLRIMDLGDGRVAMDARAVEQLQQEPDDSDGTISQDEDGGGLQIWLEGTPYPVSPAGD